MEDQQQRVFDARNAVANVLVRAGDQYIYARRGGVLDGPGASDIPADESRKAWLARRYAPALDELEQRGVEFSQSEKVPRAALAPYLRRVYILTNAPSLADVVRQIDVMREGIMMALCDSRVFYALDRDSSAIAQAHLSALVGYDLPRVFSSSMASLVPGSDIQDVIAQVLNVDTREEEAIKALDTQEWANLSSGYEWFGERASERRDGAGPEQW